MSYTRTSTVIFVVLFILSITAYGVIQLYVPKSQMPTAEELSSSKRVCDRINAITGSTTLENGPLVASDCVGPNRSCEKTWGLHSVWGGLSDSGNVPICVCADGYQWATDGSGKCVTR